MSEEEDGLVGVKEAAKRFMGRRQEDPVATWYQQMVESAPDALILIDSEGKILLANAQAEKLFGHPREDLINSPVERLVPEKYRKHHVAHREGYFGDPNVREMGAGFDLLGLRADGSEFPVEISLSPLRTERGVFTTAAIRDATGRKKAQDQLRNLLDTAPDAMVIIGQDGAIVQVNAQTERVFGYQRESLIGKPIEILVPESVRERHKGHIKHYFEDPKLRPMGAGLELRGRRKNGLEFPIEISLSPLETEDGMLATAAVRDITDRKKAQEQIRNLLETAPDAMVIINQDGKISLVNRQTEYLFGYQREELLGQSVEILVPTRLRERHPDHVRAYFQEPRVREMGAGLQLTGQCKDGSEFPIEISLSPLQTEDGMLATAAIRDVTDRKDSERKIAAYARNLERSNRELEQFAYVASHDLQAPLRNIASFSKLLQREVEGKISAESDEYFGFIEDSAKQMQSLISDILQLSRVSQVDREPALVSLDDVVAQAVKQLQSTIAERNALIEYQDLPVVWGDELLLVQVFQNLIGNGMKFQKSDVVPQVEVRVVQAPQNHWRIEVADNGIGIQDEHLGRIFEIFQRLHTHEQYPGTGIGLSLCKKIIEENHGGEIGVQSEVGVGTVFWFTLPADEASKGAMHV